MGATSRQKGKRGEREAAKEIARLFRVEAKRGQQFQGSPDSPDVVADIPGIHFEVKRTERLKIWGAIEQAVADAGDNLPVVLHRANNKPYLAIVRLDDLPALAWKLYFVLCSNPS